MTLGERVIGRFWLHSTAGHLVPEWGPRSEAGTEAVRLGGHLGNINNAARWEGSEARGGCRWLPWRRAWPVAALGHGHVALWESSSISASATLLLGVLLPRTL